jgi:quinol monooxygenase YgiN
MNQVGLLVRLEAKAGQEQTVAEFLEGAVRLANQEAGTTTWVAFQIAEATFSIFDINPDEAGRQAHLQGQIAATIMGNAAIWLSKPPQIEAHRVLSAKLPG